MDNAHSNFIENGGCVGKAFAVRIGSRRAKVPWESTIDHSSFQSAMPDKSTKTDRRYSRIATPKGVWVAWQDGARQEVSRVQDLNIGGLFVATENPSAVGKIISILLSVPEGEIRGRAVVRNVTSKGMGIEFVELREQDSARLHVLIARLLPASQASSGN
jgi:PilZ domain